MNLSKKCTFGMVD